MIRSIDTTDSTAGTTKQPAGQATAATAAGKPFSSVLERQKASSSAATTPSSAKIDAPQGEVWAPVAGHDNAAKIAAGPRAGQYINLSHGDRRGQLFTVEQRAGKTVHIYGSGQGGSEKVIDAQQDMADGVRKIHGKPVKSQAQPAKGEQWAPVEGHSSYADILSGKRNGLYVNISGGLRDGMAFQIVKHGARTYHVYGSGAHRQVIEVGAHKKATPTSSPSSSATSSSTTAPSTSSSAATGGTGGAPVTGGL